MDDKTRARNYYAAAVILFQDPSADDCKIVIELLEKSLDLYSDLDVRVLIGEVWHYLLKSLDKHNKFGTYEKYRYSPAWQRKRDLVIERDKGKCVWCHAEGRQVHHKTYANIGQEPLSDLVMLCGRCHETEHGDPLARKAFIAYIKHESNILKLAYSGRGSSYINYETGYPTKSGLPEIQLSAWLPVDYNDVAAVISIRSDSTYFQSHYKKLEEHKSEIEDTFPSGEVKFRSSKDGKMYHLRVVKKGVDLMQTAGRDLAFHWLHESLEKLYELLRVPYA